MRVYKKETDSSGAVTASEVDWDFFTTVSGTGEWTYYVVGALTQDATFEIVYQTASWLLAGAVTIGTMAVTVSF